MKSLQIGIKRQILTFLVYLTICSLMLFNRRGGGDILFTFMITSSIIIHGIVIVAKLIKKYSGKVNNQYSYFDLLVFLILTVGFYSLIDQYLEIMWKVTS